MVSLDDAGTLEELAQTLGGRAVRVERLEKASCSIVVEDDRRAFLHNLGEGWLECLLDRLRVVQVFAFVARHQAWTRGG